MSGTSALTNPILVAVGDAVAPAVGPSTPANGSSAARKSPSRALSSSMEEPSNDRVGMNGTPIAPASSRSDIVSIDQFWTDTVPARIASATSGWGAGNGYPSPTNLVSKRLTRPPMIKALHGEPTPVSASVQPGLLPHHCLTSSLTSALGRPWAAPA